MKMLSFITNYYCSTYNGTVVAWNAFLIVILCSVSIKALSIFIAASLSFACFSALGLLPITTNLCKAKFAG